MNEIIYSGNANYAKYKELLIRRDSLRKEAYQWERMYTREFGDEILKVFDKKVNCIKLKKAIAYCQKIRNYGGNVDLNKLHEYLAEEMAEYQKQLDGMIADNEASKKGKPITQYDLLQIKKIYRRLAKKMHPDMNPEIADSETLSALWDRAMIAYNCNDLEELKELEVVINAELEKSGIETEKTEIPDIEEKIAALEAEIKQIMETNPYKYQFLLDDDDAVKEMHEELAEEYKEYEKYEKQLDEMVSDYLKGGISIIWRMN